MVNREHQCYEGLLISAEILNDVPSAEGFMAVEVSVVGRFDELRIRW